MEENNSTNSNKDAQEQEQTNPISSLNATENKQDIENSVEILETVDSKILSKSTKELYKMEVSKIPSENNIHIIKTGSNTIKYKIYYFLHSSSLIIILIGFYINYLKTNDTIEKNRSFINLKPISICDTYLDKLDECLNKTQKIIENIINKTNSTNNNINNTAISTNLTNTTNVTNVITGDNFKNITSNGNYSSLKSSTRYFCREENNKLRTCYDQVYWFSRHCQYYLNDLYDCKKKENKKLKECLNIHFINCAKPYSYVNISKTFDFL